MLGSLERDALQNNYARGSEIPAPFIEDGKHCPVTTTTTTTTVPSDNKAICYEKFFEVIPFHPIYCPWRQRMHSFAF